MIYSHIVNLLTKNAILDSTVNRCIEEKGENGVNKRVKR
jgi:hypothetical protein